MSSSTTGHRGRASDALDGIRRALHTGAAFVSDRERARIHAVFFGDEHVEVEAETTSAVNERIVTCYRNPERTATGFWQP